jgi:hypothetical protein
VHRFSCSHRVQGSSTGAWIDAFRVARTGSARDREETGGPYGSRTRLFRLKIGRPPKLFSAHSDNLPSGPPLAFKGLDPESECRRPVTSPVGGDVTHRWRNSRVPSRASKRCGRSAMSGERP